MMSRFVAAFESMFPGNLPVLKTMPRHIAEMPINIGVLALRMRCCDKPSTAVDVGYRKGTK